MNCAVLIFGGKFFGFNQSAVGRIAGFRGHFVLVCFFSVCGYISLSEPHFWHLPVQMQNECFATLGAVTAVMHLHSVSIAAAIRVSSFTIP